MQPYQIVKHPHNFLSTPANPVAEKEFGTQKLKDKCARMAITMMRAGGVGLAGNQVGIMQRIIVINTLTHGGVRLTLINPEIQEISTETEIDGEGCLSFPNQIARVKRNLKIKMRYFTTDGEEVFRSFEGFTARALQHEMDHLIGLTMVDVQE